MLKIISEIEERIIERRRELNNKKEELQEWEKALEILKKMKEIREEIKC